MSRPPADPPFQPYDPAHYDAGTSVGHQLNLLVLQMRRVVEWRMAEHGLTDAQWKPLWLLKSGLAGSAHELVRLLSVDAGAVTRLVDRLEAKGLVERLRSEADRRVVLLRLTEAGEAAVAEVPAVLAGVNNDYLRGFSEADWHQARALIERLLVNGAALQTERSET